MNLDLVVQEIHCILLPLTQKCFIGNLGWKGLLCCLRQELHELVNLCKALFPFRSILSWQSFWYMWNGIRHGKHGAHRRMQFLGLVVASHLPKRFAACNVVCRPSIWKFPILVFVVCRFKLIRLEVRFALLAPLQVLGDQDVIGRGCSDVPKVELWHAERNVVAHKYVEDNLWSVMVPHHGHEVPVGSPWLVWKFGEEVLVQVRFILVVLHGEGALEPSAATNKLLGIVDLNHSIVQGEHATLVEGLRQPSWAKLYELVSGVWKLQPIVVTRIIFGCSCFHIHVLDVWLLYHLPWWRVSLRSIWSNLHVRDS
mmetsp:Transcript_35483/g.81204  ORF Transcript_35483/g.81204 Transcript_35483/m.81204 type:complete len:312 (+) Transcript_35483:735-1670(+)